ncbi:MULTISPECIES: hypothetical protein [unclassified Streptomyces]|uniref:hypothetical protein n=1 Tax=unclassified Streptomyces TaxID=2593676 RepID=UPI002E2820BE|nr:hypothetical protein [Streptomyces sp. NBC_00223]
MTSPALHVLRRGAEGLSAHLQPSGELHDPVFAEPTQYGTAYYAYVNAALASLTEGPERARYADAARRGLTATLDHLLDPDSPTPTTRYYPAVGSPGTDNLRDFMWPPALRALRLLRAVGAPDLDPVAERIRRVAVPDAFNKRPPVNWASVWMSGEWLRIGDGLSPYDQGRMDEWLEPFLTEAIDLEAGFYREPGLPNSYDLFTRVHLLYLLADGYAGAHRKDLERLLVTGLRRSLAVQLSSGSLAGAHRSTGQVWTLGAQCSYFHQAAALVKADDPALAAAADAAAVRSLHAMADCFRPAGDLSPVENVLPANHRVGYEVYTSDPHYVSLPLGFLATAVLAGFTGEEPAGRTAADREPVARVEGEPVHRALLHADGWSVHLNLGPRDGYVTADQAFDAFGIADLTLGPRRRLRFGGQVHHMATGTPLTLGIAVHRPDRSIQPVAALRPSDRGPAVVTGRRLEAVADFDGLAYRIAVDLGPDEARIVEEAPGHPVSLLVPYLRDRGDGRTTEVRVDGGRVRLTAGDEEVVVEAGGPVLHTVHLPHGYESRHGLVGLVRIDLAGTGRAAYRVRRVR